MYGERCDVDMYSAFFILVLVLVFLCFMVLLFVYNCILCANKRRW